MRIKKRWDTEKFGCKPATLKVRKVFSVIRTASFPMVNRKKVENKKACRKPVER